MEQPTVNIHLTIEELNLIIKALEARPYGEVSTLLPNIINQGQTQLQEQNTKQPE